MGFNSGSICHVNASWFYDGFGIAGELGDVIRIEGQSGTARITSINYSTNTIVLDKALSWQDGDGVHVAYGNLGPDTGAFELTEPAIKPEPPADFM